MTLGRDRRKRSVGDFVTDERRMIFVVDDDEWVRDSLCALLESSGFSVRTFASAREFLEEAPRLDDACMLLDVHMPSINGIELLTMLRERHHTLPVIMITGRQDGMLRERVRAAGAVALFDKPLAAPRLLETIRAALTLSKPSGS